MNTLERMLAGRIVAIMRGDYGGQWLSYADALLEGGITVMEITLNSPGALDGMRELASRYGDQILLGAGTVLTAEEVARAADAGATFIVAPDTDPAVIEASKQRGLVVTPGAYTATEVKHAYSLGADMVKLFPAQTPDYLKAIRAPLNHIPLMATGGVDVDNAAAFFKAGAAALGVGSNLTKPNLPPGEVARRAREFAAVAQTA